MKPGRVFYSWSSDNDSRVCRDLIREALNQACKQLTAELDEADREVVLDHDTKGISGSPAIMEAIEQKIQDCDFFVADLTPVAIQDRPDDKPRLLPNPNVMYELGYAYNAIGSDRILGVINTAFAENARKENRILYDGVLPFNLRHRRHPACYELKEDADKASLRAERDYLVKVFLDQIRTALKAVPISTIKPFVPQPPLERQLSTFIPDEEMILSSSYNIIWRNEKAQVYVRFVPDSSMELTPLKLNDACKKSKLGIPPSSGSCGDFGPNKYGYINCTTKALPDDIVISKNAIQFFRSGEVWAMFGSFLQTDKKYISPIVGNIFSYVAQKTATFIEATGYTGSGKVIVGLTDISGRIFLTSNHLNPASPFKFYEDNFLSEHSIQNCNRQSLGEAVNIAMTKLWEEAGLERPQEDSIQFMEAFDQSQG